MSIGLSYSASGNSLFLCQWRLVVCGSMKKKKYSRISNASNRCFPIRKKKNRARSLSVGVSWLCV